MQVLGALRGKLQARRYQTCTAYIHAHIHPPITQSCLHYSERPKCIHTTYMSDITEHSRWDYQVGCRWPGLTDVCFLKTISGPAQFKGNPGVVSALACCRAGEDGYTARISLPCGTHGTHVVEPPKMVGLLFKKWSKDEESSDLVSCPLFLSIFLHR